MEIFNNEEFVPKKHLLRKIRNAIYSANAIAVGCFFEHYISTYQSHNEIKTEEQTATFLTVCFSALFNSAEYILNFIP